MFLNSDSAIKVNISIMPAFVKMHKLLRETDDLRLMIESLQNEYDDRFEIVFVALNKLLEVETSQSNKKPVVLFGVRMIALNLEMINK